MPCHTARKARDAWIKVLEITALVIAITLPATAPAQQAASRRMVLVDEADTMRREPPRHGAIGSSIAYPFAR